MNVLMIGNCASVGWNLTQGLRKKNINVVFVGNSSKCISGRYDCHLSWRDFLQKGYGKKHFDIIHIHSPNFKLLGLAFRYLKGDTKLVCHWHGSDLRMFRKTFPVHWLLKKIAVYHLYSTIDLAWWLRSIDKSKKQLFRCPVDIDLFKPNGNKKNGLLILLGGAKTSIPILHDYMSEHINNFGKLQVYPAYGLSEKLLQVSLMEGAACGLNVINHSWINRDWVINNASIESQTKKLINIYNEVLKK